MNSSSFSRNRAGLNMMRMRFGRLFWLVWQMLCELQMFRQVRSRVSVLRTRERRRLFGTAKQESQFIMHLFGNRDRQREFVRICAKVGMRLSYEKRQVY